MTSGGYHPPANPAQVSGPGALSRRTDQPQPMMQIPDAKYGEQKDFQEIQGGAPMSAPSGGAPQMMPAGMPAPPSLMDPSQRPGEPVTAGASMGQGPGTEALNMPSDTRESLRKMYGPILPALIVESQSRYATQEMKDAVAALIAIL